MTYDEPRKRELLEWAIRFSGIAYQAEDVRCRVQAHVRKILEIMNQQPVAADALEQLQLAPEDHANALRRMAIDLEDWYTQLDILQARSITVTATAKLEQANEARKKGGETTAEARKKGAAFTEQKVKDHATRLRTEGVPEHKLISSIVKATGLSRSAVTKYLPKK